jgi:hypothetical protein
MYIPSVDAVCVFECKEDEICDSFMYVGLDDGQRGLAHQSAQVEGLSSIFFQNAKPPPRPRAAHTLLSTCTKVKNGFAPT